MLSFLYIYRAECLRVIDGDTFVARIDMGFNTYTIQTVRLEGVDTPEITGPEKEKGLEVKEFMEEWLLPRPGLPKGLIVRTEKEDSFGRWLSTVWAEEINGKWCNLNDLLLTEELAVEYP